MSPRVRGGEVMYARGGVVEWYRAGPLGIEQGFMLARRPAGRSGAVTLAMKLGGLRARPSGSGVEFVARSGQVALRYGGLVAFDASGRRVAAWLALSGSRLLLRVNDRGARYPLRIDPFIQQGSKLIASDESGAGQFGASVAVSGDGNTALVGGPADNGNVGAAWVFTRSGSTWSQQGAKLTASDEGGAGRFGGSVALSGDGSTALIGGGADNSGVGAAWVFSRSGSTWSQQGAKLTASDESGAGQFGVAVALSGDGNTALIGGDLDNSAVGAAWVFTRSGSTWSQQGAKLTGTGESGPSEFGLSVALSGDGNTALIGGAFDDLAVGAAWVFTRSGSTWSQQGAKLTGTDEIGVGGFGWSVALSGDGNTALIGGVGDNGFVGAAWVFTRSGSTWSQQGAKLTGTGEIGAGGFGVSVALPGAGCTALIGGHLDNDEVGAAWAFVDQVPPTITSPAGATFVVDRAGSFTITTGSGCQTPSLTESGTLPAGVSFTDNGNGTAILSGIPAAGAGGIYHLTITASNGVSPDATQSFTLIVEAPPTVAITTPSSGARYAPRQVVKSSFSCTEGPGGPGLVSCLDQNRRGSGAPIDTATVGSHTFTVTAISEDGLTASKTVTYTVLAPARMRITALRPSPLRHGCATESGSDEREITAVLADATCRHLRLTVQGLIEVGGKLALSAGGNVQVSFKVTLPLGRSTGGARAKVIHGRWGISLVLPGVNLDPVPPSYLITARYEGDNTTQQAMTKRAIRLESERAGLNP
ncbi:MAG: hypothetical protein JOZ98_04380 [Solirubrobacterales bacterium]|nr:hypothetical protein [Solirubrobacterales bacterium]